MKNNKTTKPEPFEPIFFAGYCPESMLKGEKVLMLLNEDDFFESPSTGLQITCFPPYAAILRWRGKGKFKQHRYEATDYYKALIFTKASTEKNKEIYPDQNEILKDSLDLEEYLRSICASHEEYELTQSNKQAEVFKKQEEHLESIAAEEWENLIELYEIGKKEGLNGEAFSELHQMLHDLGIIFRFDWMNSIYSKELFQSKTMNFSSCDLFQLSIYVTIIFRSDRFNNVCVKTYFDNGILSRLFTRFENYVKTIVGLQTESFPIIS